MEQDGGGGRGYLDCSSYLPPVFPFMTDGAVEDRPSFALCEYQYIMRYSYGLPRCGPLKNMLLGMVLRSDAVRCCCCCCGDAAGLFHHRQC